MGTHASDFRLITRKPSPVVNQSPATYGTHQCADAERDVVDGGGSAFMVFLMVLALSALAWWLV